MREAASKELKGVRRVGRAGGAPVALEKGPPLEVRLRATAFLRQFDRGETSPARVRQVRAVELLEGSARRRRRRCSRSWRRGSVGPADPRRRGGDEAAGAAVAGGDRGSCRAGRGGFATSPAEPGRTPEREALGRQPRRSALWVRQDTDRSGGARQASTRPTKQAAVVPWPPRSPRALEQVEEAVLVLLEQPEPVQLLLQLERLRRGPSPPAEQPLDPVPVRRARPRLRGSSSAGSSAGLALLASPRLPACSPYCCSTRASNSPSCSSTDPGLLGQFGRGPGRSRRWSRTPRGWPATPSGTAAGRRRAASRRAGTRRAARPRRPPPAARR